MPQYPGGMAKLMKAVKANLKYPEDGEAGRVILRFVVKSDGKVGPVMVKQGVSPELVQAAIKAVKPLVFEPGKMNGKPVNVWFTMPITINKDNK